MEVDIVSGETEVATKETSFVALIVALDLALEIFEVVRGLSVIICSSSPHQLYRTNCRQCPGVRNRFAS
jgi:hypothetical protein